jgi:tripartite-type tricarboxylate transporter receptor subunit TctC
MFPTSGSVASHIKAGRVRALAVSTSVRSTAFPDLPTIAEAGVPGYESVAITGMFAPARTPASTISRLSQEIMRFLGQPDVKEKFTNIGVEAVGGSAEELAAKMKSEMSRMGKVIRDAGIRAE